MSKNFTLKSCNSCMLPETYEILILMKMVFVMFVTAIKIKKSNIDWNEREKTLKNIKF